MIGNKIHPGAVGAGVFLFRRRKCLLDLVDLDVSPADFERAFVFWNSVHLESDEALLIAFRIVDVLYHLAVDPRLNAWANSANDKAIPVVVLHGVRLWLAWA